MSFQASRTRRKLFVIPATMFALAGLIFATTPVIAADQSVVMQNFAFSPGSVSVEVGDTVTWENMDEAPHTATADDGFFDTGSLDTGDTGEVTFDTAGDFSYFCEIHPDMTGTVTVAAAAGDEPTAEPTEEAGATGEATQPPTDTLDRTPFGDIPGGLGTVLVAIGVAILCFLLVGGYGPRRDQRES